MMVLRKCSNGSLSRKKNDSFVVIASATSVTSGSFFTSRSFATKSAKVAMPARCATGSNRLSTKYCLSADSMRPERSLSSLRK